MATTKSKSIDVVTGEDLLSSSFQEYVSLQPDDNGPRGDFIRDVSFDTDFPRTATWKEIEEYLLKMRASKAFMSEARKMFDEYEKLSRSNNGHQDINEHEWSVSLIFGSKLAYVGRVMAADENTAIEIAKKELPIPKNLCDRVAVRRA
jgi:hypothetical protein